MPQATDQGVTADSIKLGFTIFKGAGLDATGFALGIRQDQRESIAAMVDSVNREGGVKGRELEHVVVEIDTTNRSTWQPACLRLTEDEKVFSVLLPGNLQGVGHACYVEHGVPAVTGAAVTMPASMIRNSQGYLVSSGASASRAMLNWADSMLRQGLIGPGKEKVGLLIDDCPEYVEAFDREVKPFLDQSKVEYEQVRVSCDIGAAQQQVAGAVLQMRQSDVGRVFLGVIFSTAQTFMQQADAQRWRPKYSVSDLWANNTNFTTRNFPASQFDGAIGTAYSRSGEEAAKKPYSPGVQRCSKILTDAGLPPITEQTGKDAEVVALCDTLFLWLAVTERLPVNFTRAQWAAAVPQVGPFPSSTMAANASFGPGKFEGGDSYALVEWRGACSCWTQVRAHEPGRF